MNYFEHFTTEAVKRMSAIYKSNLTNEMKLAHFNELSKKCFDFENQPDANAYLKDGMPGVDKIDKRIKKKGDEDGKLLSRRNVLRTQLKP